MLEINAKLSIADAELMETFVRSSGPGGQNVNKVSSAVELRFDVARSPSLPETLRARLLARRDRRLTAEGVLVIQANRFRDQSRNREDARLRLVEIIRAALLVPKARIATRPTHGSKERRLTGKRVISSLKKARSRSAWDHE